MVEGTMTHEETDSAPPEVRLEHGELHSSRTHRFAPGRVVNPFRGTLRPADAVGEMSRAVAPARLATFLSYHQYFMSPPRPGVYPVGDVNFVVDRYTEAVVERIPGGETVIDADPDRVPLVRHVVLLMRHLLGIGDGLRVTARTLHDVRHGGLASSSALQGAVALAINELYGGPADRRSLARFLSQNYGEECGEADALVEMPSLGGGSASALIGAHAIFIAGETEVAGTFTLPDGIGVVLAIPKVRSLPDGAEDFALFQRGRDLFQALGAWGDVKAGIVAEEVMPGLERGDVGPLFRHVTAYSLGAYGPIPEYFANRWAASGIDFGVLTREVFAALRPLVAADDACFFVSSGGPSFAALTRDIPRTVAALQSLPFATVEELRLDGRGPAVEVR